MEDINEFFAGILGIADPWTVAGVQRDEAAGQVMLQVEFDRSRAGDLGGHLLDYVDREWRHLDTCQYRTVIRARVPQVKRPDGTTAEVDVPWAEKFF